MSPGEGARRRGSVAILGSLNLDVVVAVERHPRPGETLLGSGYAEHAGGKGLNQAVAAARAGAAVEMHGAVGSDDAGDRLRRLAVADGVDVAGVAVVDGATGRAVIAVDAAGENTIIVVDGANGRARAPDQVTASVVLAQLEVPVAEVERLFVGARRHGATTVLNPAPARPLPDSLVPLIDVLVPNEHEVELLGGVPTLLGRGVHAVIVTRGAAGVDVHTGDGHRHQPPFEVQPVDTTGAGDAFCGTLAARLAAGDELDRAVQVAAAAGALATTVAGAVPSMPSAAAVAALVSRAR